MSPGMARTKPKQSFPQVNALVGPLLVLLLCLHSATGMSGWGGCQEGQDVFATVSENSLSGELVTELMADTSMDGSYWTLDGKDAHWFYLDGKNLRLNASAEKVLDRETQGPVLLAELSCYEEETLQGVYRIVVEILNENDHTPVFADSTIQSLVVSELIPVNTVVFTVEATDADNDKIIYSIDQTSPDAEYFKVDLPNSGEVILSKPLDYETKSLLTVTIHATEMSTAEHFNTSTNITITVQDGDDQYPQFLPCILPFQDEISHICSSPVYTVNITEGEEDIVLNFSPGPIHAVDGDRGLRSPVSYAILSGDDDGRFLMDKQTGEMRLTRGVRDRLTTPALHLQVMAYQDDDPRKYSVATVLVRVLALNQFNPEFDMPVYHGFVIAGKDSPSLVITYGNKALMLHVLDKDFTHGFNPMIYFTFSPTSNHTDMYQITQEGLLIARTSQLKAKQKHFLEVIAIDQESGDAAFATIVVEVLPEGQAVPYSPLGDERLTGCTVGKALFLCMVFMTLLGGVLLMVMWLKRKHKGHKDPLERGCVAQGKHPNVSLRWFQLVNHRSGMPQMEDRPLSSEDYGTCNPSFSFTHQDLPPHKEPDSSKTTAAPDTNPAPTEPIHSPVILQNNLLTTPESSSTSPTLHPVTVNMSLQCTAPDPASPNENLSPITPPSDATVHPSESFESLKTIPSPASCDASSPPPDTCPDSNTFDHTTTPSSQSSPSSVPRSHTRIASAEIDKPFRKSRANTPPNRPYSPLLSTAHTKPMKTPPPTPEHSPVKATLIHTDISPPDSPPKSPNQSSEIDQPSTSLDHTDHPEEPADNGSPPQDRRPSTNSGNTQDSNRVGDDDDGFLGDEDVDKNSDGELEAEDEELLRALARCGPVFITITK
ncbi:cadherin-related family member 5 [Sphaeramia orbicularis]|uniref:cadherin-related family member 5 n=1 Tax=Sphaeramia orbicularis TaxID=375764 RepID=UPI00118060F6|nr:cadherin-related family member 5-like [Sphaeramia orbicularis]